MPSMREMRVPVDREKLLAFAIPAGRQTLTPRDVAFYALSIGMGQQALDASELRYVDPVQGPEVMPAMVLVLAHPGFWLAHPDSGVDPKMVLHGSQDFEILAPIPTHGEVRSTSRVTGLSDKGEGKAAIIFSDTDLFDESGTRFARMNRTIFVRNGGGCGSFGETNVTATPAPEGAPDIVLDLPTRPEQALYYRLNGDFNPLHSDPALATRLGFQRPILHGLCTMGVIAHALLRCLADHDSGRLHGMSLRFSAPVLPGETIRTEIWNSGQFRARAVERDVVVADQGFVTILPAGAV